MQWLQGKRTILGSLALSLLSAMYFLDMMDGAATWLSEAQYLTIGGVITGLTGVAMRLGIATGK